MKVFCAFVLVLVAVECVSFHDVLNEEWSLFKLEHSKNYTSGTEDSFRFKIFMDNKNKIAKHNSRFERGLVSFKLKMNNFGDMLHHEFVSIMNGFNKTKSLLHSGGNSSYFIEPTNVVLPKTMDWRTKGAVTPVKNQHFCGSCWAFSSTGSLEGQHFRKTGKLVSLSEQNLIDCSKSYGNNGCHGGYMDNSFKYVKNNHGIDTENSYPYESKEDKCRYKPESSGAIDSGFVDLPKGNEQQLMTAVATIGPVSVAIDASHDSFQLYSAGVYYEPECSSTKLDHGVLVVGYGTEDSSDYWLVKNSWGKDWGEEGYIKMARNKNNNCGIATFASYPLV